MAGSAGEAPQALMILNTGETPARGRRGLYFLGREPLKGIALEVGAERIRTLRLDRPADIGGVSIGPLTQYAIRLRSDVPVVAQFGRVDTTQNNMAYYCAPAISEA